jgi:hypothetical protein
MEQSTEEQVFEQQLLEQQTHTLMKYTLVFNTWFLGRPKPSIWGVWAAPAAPTGAKPPTFWHGLRGPPGPPRPQKTTTSGRPKHHVTQMKNATLCKRRHHMYQGPWHTVPPVHPGIPAAEVYPGPGHTWVSHTHKENRPRMVAGGPKSKYDHPRLQGGPLEGSLATVMHDVAVALRAAKRACLTAPVARRGCNSVGSRVCPGPGCTRVPGKSGTGYGCHKTPLICRVWAHGCHQTL